MSTELLRVSLLHGASNDIVLPGDGTSRGGEILCKLVGDGKSLAARVLPPQPGAGSWHQAEFMDQTMILSQLCPPTPPLNPLLIVVSDFV